MNLNEDEKNFIIDATARHHEKQEAEAFFDQNVLDGKTHPETTTETTPLQNEDFIGVESVSVDAGASSRRDSPFLVEHKGMVSIEDRAISRH